MKKADVHASLSTDEAGTHHIKLKWGPEQEAAFKAYDDDKKARE